MSVWFVLSSLPNSRDMNFLLWYVQVPLMQNLESLQYNVALAITGAWRGTSTDRIYEELWGGNVM